MRSLHSLLQPIKDNRAFVLQIGGKVCRVLEGAPWETLRGT